MECGVASRFEKPQSDFQNEILRPFRHEFRVFPPFNGARKLGDGKCYPAFLPRAYPHEKVRRFERAVRERLV